MMGRGTIALVAVALVASSVVAAQTAQQLYGAALARERTVRATLSAPGATVAVLKDVRALIAAYEAIVKQHPASGYSDNALWQAGCLALDTFVRFGQAQDKTTSIRLLRALRSTYPTSSLVKQVPQRLARLEPPAPGVPSPGVATIKAIRRTVLPDAVRITIETDREVSFRDDRLAHPARVFVDLKPTRPAPSLDDRTLRFEGDADVVRQIRIGRHPNNMTRVVLDAMGVSACSVYPVYDPYRLVIDCLRAETRAPLATRQLAPLVSQTAPSVSARGATAIADALAASRAQPASDVRLRPSSTPARPAPIPTKAPNGGGMSVARQLGLGVSRIVIDPGHGGHDPGAQGKGITEAELVLDVALRLEKLLLKLPGTTVLLTRRTNDFIGLQERTAIANRETADLFLSIHANASSNVQASGVETYFLNFANNLNAASVASRENTASGQTMGALTDFVKAIALNNKLDESQDFAAEVQRSLVQRLRVSNKSVKDLGVKQAPFVVLIGAEMPSVLAEISFVTNTQEARLLRGAAYRQRIAEALSTAIQKYQASLKSVARVARQ